MNIANMNTTSRPLQITGFVLLIIGSYIDTIRGPLLPIIVDYLKVNYETASRLLTVGNFAACIALIIMIPLIKRVGEVGFIKLSSIAIIGAGILSVYVDNVNAFYVFAALLGVGTGVYGALSTIFVVKGTPKEKHANMISGLQVMYGLSSMFAPLSIALILHQKISWVYLFILLIPMTVAFNLFVARKVKLPPETAPPKEHSDKMGSIHLILFITFCFYVTSEVSCSMWMTSFLVDIHKLTVESASYYTSIFFLLMMGSRLACFFFLNEKNQKYLLVASLAIPLITMTLGILTEAYWLLPIAGLFGPFWPIFMAKVTRSFPTQWKALTMWLLFGLQFSLLCMNYAVGKLTEITTMQNAYLIAPIFCVLTIFCYGLLKFRKRDF